MLTTNAKQNQIKSGAKVFAYILVIPALIHFLIFWLYVKYKSILMAFTVNIGGVEVLSMENFAKLFRELGRYDTDIYKCLLNTFKYWSVHMIKTILCSAVAYFLYKKVYGYKIYRIIFFLPSMIPGMVYISIFRNFISTYGPLWTVVNGVFGTEMPELLSNEATATNVILFYSLWSGFGAQMLIFVGTMNRIPEDVIDAATLDGCLGIKEYIFIVVPLIWETLATYLLIGFTGIFTASGPILYFTGGDFGTQTLSYWIFAQTRAGQYNYPSAIGIFFTVLNLPIVFIVRKLMNKVETVSY